MKAETKAGSGQSHESEGEARAPKEESGEQERLPEALGLRKVVASESDDGEAPNPDLFGGPMIQKSEEPDVLLDVPVVKVDEIALEVDNLRARVSLHAGVGNLVQLDVGADVEIGRVKLDIKGVEAKALLKVHLEQVHAILARTLQTVDRHPELLQSLVKPLGETVGELGPTVRETLPEVGTSVGHAAEETLPQVGESAGKTIEQTVPEVGRSAGRTVERTVPDVGRFAGDTLESVDKTAEGAVGELTKSAGAFHGTRRAFRRARGAASRGARAVVRSVGRVVSPARRFHGQTQQEQQAH